MLCGSHIEIWNLANHMKTQKKKYQNAIFINEKWKLRIWYSLYHFFHVICKISNFNMWTAKHLAQASCTELNLKKNSWTLTECHVLKNFESPRMLNWRTSVNFTTWPWHHLRRRIKQHWDQATFPFPVRSFWECEPNFTITDKLTVCAGLSKISKVAPEGR